MSHVASPALAVLLRDASMEMTAKDVDKLAEAKQSMPDRMRINVTALATEDFVQQLDAARVVRDLGFVPVPMSRRGVSLWSGSSRRVSPPCRRRVSARTCSWWAATPTSPPAPTPTR